MFWSDCNDCPLVSVSARGNLKKVSLPYGFEEKLSTDVFDNTADVRIMSSNLLVHYESWGGLPAKPRSKQYVEILNSYKPDVVGIQELCDEWYCCVNNNLPEGYKMLYPFTTGAFVRMTAMLYNADTLDVVENGNFAYKEKDNPRLRRVVWAVFEVKATGKQFAVTNTHFDLLREGREEELTAVMHSQADELIEFVNSIADEYNCPVFSVGDFNTMEDTAFTNPVDIPEIYNKLAQNFTDSKFNCENKVCGTQQDWNYPSYDHIFIKGNAKAQTFSLMSYAYLTDMSDHYPIFADIKLSDTNELKGKNSL